MSNFAYLPDRLASVAEEAMQAEAKVNGDPRAACLYARRTLEETVHWLYRHDRDLHRPYDDKLGALLHETTFQNLVPQEVYQKMRLVQKASNQAVHGRQTVAVDEAMRLVREMHHVCFWLMRTYLPAMSRDGAGWKDERVPAAVSGADVVPRQELEALEAKLAAAAEKELARQQERDELDAEMQRVRAELTAARAAAEQVPDTHDYGEADTRRHLIDVELRRAGWPLDQARDREYEVSGMPNETGVGYADYVLWGDDGLPLAVVEAKKSTVDPATGRQQAKLYADALERMHGQRPLIFYTNGYAHWLWDDRDYPPRRVGGFYAKEALSRLIVRREQRTALSVADIDDDIAGRYYQKRVIGSVLEQFDDGRRKALLVMATGTGKTRTAIALIDVLQRAGRVKRALFLADRKSLVRQAANAFKVQLRESSPVNLVTDKRTDGRVYVCTYPTMMGLIDRTQEGTARFDVGHFDLIVIDEAHRSVYRKYAEIFEYFDSLLVGLTATPREEIDRNTYDLFQLEAGVPTDAYELETAVKDGFLVPPNVFQVDLRFPRDGIDYDALSDEEKALWEETDWGDDDGGPPPAQVEAPAINSWLFNTDTVDKVLQHVMEHGHKVESGDRLAKTIVFARNHRHATFIEERFNHHYPRHAGHFARVIDNRAKYPESLIDDFSVADKAPHIAISVDMLDTGIDVPEVLNLVFFKPVYSRIKFWQMIGRGTRLCPDVFGPGDDKADFRVFDFCFNFDFFRETPEGRTTSDAPALATRLFRSRVQLLDRVRETPEHDPDALLDGALVDALHAEVDGMNPDNFIVRLRYGDVERFRERARWSSLDSADLDALRTSVAGLPSDMPTDDVESRRFDLTALRMQLALVEGDEGGFEKLRQRVMEIAVMLEEKPGDVPAIKKQLAYLAALQRDEFWEGIGLVDLEDLRERLRGLVPFLDKTERRIVYTSFRDEVLGVREEAPVAMPSMTGVQYEKKVREYLKAHLDHLVVHRLRTNRPLTATDLAELERVLTEIGGDDGAALLASLVERSEATSLERFVRGLVGLDRAAAQAAFADFLADRALTPPQIRFVEMLIDQLTVRGIMEPEALYEAPFTSLHAGGPDGLFDGDATVIDGLFGALKSAHRGLEPVARREGRGAA